MKTKVTHSLIVAVLLTAGTSMGATLISGNQQNGSAQLSAFEPFVLGNSFTVGANDLEVTALGYYDFTVGGGTGDGLTDTHDVGIYNSSGSLIASVTVPSGTVGTLLGDYRYASLASTVTLTAGQTYTLAGTTGDNPGGVNAAADQYYLDSDLASVGSVTIASDVTWNYRAQANGNVLVFPAQNPPGQTGTQAWLSTNLQYNVIPEPNAFGLLLMALSIPFAIRRFRM